MVGDYVIMRMLTRLRLRFQAKSVRVAKLAVICSQESKRQNDSGMSLTVPLQVNHCSI